MESILIVEDDQNNLHTIAEILETEGYSTFKASDKKKGLDLANQYLPDLIISDIKMPDGDEGFELLEELKKKRKTQQMPFIFLTMRAESKDIVKGFNLGASDYIVKSSEPAEILVRVKTHLELSALRKKSEQKSRDLEKKQRRLAQMNEILKDSKKLNEKSKRFAYDILGDQLQIIQSQIELLKSKRSADPLLNNNLNTIEKCCDEIQTTMKNFLEK